MPTINLRKFGVNDLGADLMAIPSHIYDFCATNNMTLRCRLDVRRGRDYYALRMWELAARGITLLPTIIWLESDDGPVHVPGTQTGRDTLQSFCADIGQVISDSWAAGHPGKCHAVEVWNEPNLPQYGGLNAYDYVGSILKPARTGVRSRAGIPIIVGGLAFGKDTGRLDAKEFIQGLYNTGGISYAPYFDAIGIHPYGYTHPTTWVSERENQSVSRAISEIDRARGAVSDGATLLVTETGRPSVTVSEHDQKLFIENLWIAIQAREPYVTGLINWHVQDRGDSSKHEYKGLHRPDWMRKEAGDWFLAINQIHNYPYLNLNQGGLDA